MLYCPFQRLPGRGWARLGSPWLPGLMSSPRRQGREKQEAFEGVSTEASSPEVRRLLAGLNPRAGGNAEQVGKTVWSREEGAE